MGAFGRAIKDLAENFGPKIVKSVEEHAPILRSVTAKIADMDTHFKLSKAGTSILERWNNHYLPELEKNKATIYQAAKSGKPVINPIGGTPLLERADIEAHAARITRKASFGNKDSHLAFLLDAAKKERGDNYANVLADHLAVAMHDSGYRQGSGVQKSALAHNLEARAKKKGPGAFSPANPQPYTRPSDTERTGKKIARGIIAPHAALPHSVSNLVTLLKDGAVPYTKALTSAVPFVNYENARFLLKSTNAISELHSIEYNQHMDYVMSGFKKNLNQKFPWVKDSVGEIIHSNYSMPGMSSMRKWNLTIGGMSAKFKAEEMAAKVLTQPAGGYAEKELIRLKLDPAKIKSQGGNLTPEDYRTAIFHGANASAFIENPMQRPELSQGHVAGRIFNIYHGYLARSSKAIASSIWEAISDKNPAKIATVFGTLGLIAPQIGNGLHFLENIVRGHSLQSSGKDYKDQESKLYGSDGFVSLLHANVEALANIGAFGVVTGYTRAMSRNQLSKAMLGPIPNKILDLGYDTAQFFGTDNNHPDAWKPLARDVIEDVPTAGIGGFAAHHLLPTKAENAEKKVKNAKAQRAAATRAKHKKPSNNPLRNLFN